MATGHECHQSSWDRHMTLSAGFRQSLSDHNSMATAPAYHQPLVDNCVTSRTPVSHHSVVQSTSTDVHATCRQSLASSRPYSKSDSNTQRQTTSAERDSPTGCSDYGCCSLGYDSSEDELTTINSNSDKHPEKRKWAEVSRCNSCEDNTESSDEEIRNLSGESKPLKFGSSPPKGLQQLSRTLSPAQFLANFSSQNKRLHCVPPRKRHRKMISVDVGAAPVVKRPCLDFEKMQVSSKSYPSKTMMSHALLYSILLKILYMYHIYA
jgi:hypothetical protein